MFTLFYFILAALGLGFLIFIHEYGHYVMARREGMIVEVFSIGFGKPLYSWKRGEVLWQFGWIPFGGYVRIAGMEKKGGLEPHEITNGFYGKTPFARIRVALSGPFVNIAFAFVAFSLLWVVGGREKPFSEYTHLIGSVDKESGMYVAGIRPGDRIDQINQVPFHQFQDFVYSAILDRAPIHIEGMEVDYLKGSEKEFSYVIEYPPKASITERLQTIFGMIRPASYLLYNAKASFSSRQDFPMKESGLEDGDRILWVDGELIFSREELVQTINEPRVLLTVKRGKEIFLSRVPKIKVGDLQIGSNLRSELEDWQHEAKISGRLQDVVFIPYNLTNRGIVEGEYSYLNDKSREEKPEFSAKSSVQVPLEKGDQILAVGGIAANSGYEVMSLLQKPRLQMIVQKRAATKPVLWQMADEEFFRGIDWTDLKSLISLVGTTQEGARQGDLQLLKPVEPRTMSQMPLSQVKKESLASQMEAQKKQIDAIKDPKQKEMALALFEQEHNQLKLGIVMQDAKVIYNPSPVVLFGQVCKETWKTLVALFTGNLAPKYLSGPVGIVQVMHQSWSLGGKEALFWLGMISLNLGILNLMPIPVLDGGHICFSLWEKITGKPLSSKTMERLIIPFVVLLIAMFLYLTYNDLLRVFKGFF